MPRINHPEDLQTWPTVLEGGWTSDTSGDGDFRIRIMDAGNHGVLGELVIPVASFTDLLRGRGRAYQEPSTLRWYGTDHVGQVSQVATLMVPLEERTSAGLVQAMDHVRQHLTGWSWDERWNHHNLATLAGTQQPAYRLHLHRYVDAVNADAHAAELDRWWLDRPRVITYDRG